MDIPLTVESRKPLGKTNPYLKPETSLRYLKGVGPKLAEMFGKKNICTVQDLIHWLPRTYRDQRIIDDFSLLVPGSYVTMYGYIQQKKTLFFRNKKKMYQMIIKTEGGYVSCKYFRLPYRGYFDNLEIDQKVKVVGRITKYRNIFEFHHPDIHPYKPEDTQESLLVPIYTELEGISQNKIRKVIDTAFTALKQNAEFSKFDPLPEWIKKEHKLLDKAIALELIHHPDKDKVQEYLEFRAPAQKRLIFEELFFIQTLMALRQAGLKKEKTTAIAPVGQLVKQLKDSLSFQLTSAQKRVLQEISEDLQKTQPMHRLVQGDVGCGKTIVSLIVACQVIESGLQAVIMAPTEILAEQHYKTAQKFLEPLGIKTALLTGRMRAKEKRETLEKLASGYTSLCIGTQALIQDPVRFKKLGLVVVDEQHRFGAQQRGLLQEKGNYPHFLVMTATPIPRSLAMTLYGDLDVSVIDEMPAGRQSIITRKTYQSKRKQVLSFLESQVQSGRQAYIVYPLVEESQKVDLKNAMDEYEKLKEMFPKFQIALIHGRLPSVEKQEIMEQFLKGDIQILVSTTVVEVGVDIPNASMMIVEHAERFGLSQLHQLRGRVGRGTYKSYCILVMSNGFSPEAKERISIMEQTQDGFKIAEADLELRGPGEFLGVRQSGLPEFKVASLIRDGRLLQTAKQSALELIKKDPELIQPEQAILKQELKKLSESMLPG